MVALPDGNLACGFIFNKTIEILDMNTGETMKTLHVENDFSSLTIMSLAVLPDGSLASGYDDDIIRIWNVSKGEIRRVLRGHRNSVICLAVLPDKTLASGSTDDTVRIWYNIF